MKSQEPHDRDRVERADPKALATARELALLIPNDAMMLFGSRARGDHRPDSDIDLLLLDGTGKESKEDNKQTRLQEAGNQAAARIYGQDPHPEVQVVPMRTCTYQRTKHSRNFLAGHIATDMVLAEGDPQRWNRNPGDFSAEPIFARRNAVEALKATTVLNEWRVKYPEEEDDLVTKAQEALGRAHDAIASRAGLTIRREESIQSIRLPPEKKGTEPAQNFHTTPAVQLVRQKRPAHLSANSLQPQDSVGGQKGCGTGAGNRPRSPQGRQSLLEPLEEIKEKQELKPKAKTPHSKETQG